MSALQKISYELFSKAKSRASEYLGSEVGLEAYLSSFAASLPAHPQRQISAQEISQKTNNSHIVLVGDFHTLEKSQSGFLDFMESSENPKNIIVALEIFQHNDPLLKKRQEDKHFKQEELLEAITKKRTWDFSKQGYKKILAYCDQHSIQLEGISPKRRSHLPNTDRVFAQRILEIRAKNPDKKVYVLVGESHLAPNHLPAELKKQQHKSTHNFLKSKVLSVLQNVDSFYFWHLNKSKNPFQSFEINKNTIATSNIAPHLKWESVLQHHAFGLDDFGVDALEKETEDAWEFATHFLNFFKVSYRRERIASLHIDIGLKNLSSGAQRAETRRDLLKKGYCWLPKTQTLTLLKDSGNIKTIATGFILLSTEKNASKSRFAKLLQKLDGVL